MPRPEMPRTCQLPFGLWDGCSSTPGKRNAACAGRRLQRQDCIRAHRPTAQHHQAGLSCILLRMGDQIVWWPNTSSTKGDRVAVVTVSYNTKELTALLLWSLRTVLDWPALEIVVVDNGSKDGSAQLLAEAEDAGICAYIRNESNHTHGPGLNQGISWLASRRGPLPTWIWVLDSDVVVARPDALTVSLTLAEHESAALLGEPWWDQWHNVDRFQTYSLLFKPAEVWQPGAKPFAEGGDPSFELLNSAMERGVKLAKFPFVADSYIIHRGRGSLAAVVASGELSNPQYEWAVTHHEPHFGLVPGARERYLELLRTFREDVGEISGSTLASACERSRQDRHGPSR